MWNQGPAHIHLAKKHRGVWGEGMKVWRFGGGQGWGWGGGVKMNGAIIIRLFVVPLTLIDTPSLF